MRAHVASRLLRYCEAVNVDTNRPIVDIEEPVLVEEWFVGHPGNMREATLTRFGITFDGDDAKELFIVKTVVAFDGDVVEVEDAFLDREVARSAYRTAVKDGRD